MRLAREAPDMRTRPSAAVARPAGAGGQLSGSESRLSRTRACWRPRAARCELQLAHAHPLPPCPLKGAGGSGIRRSEHGRSPAHAASRMRVLSRSAARLCTPKVCTHGVVRSTTAVHVGCCTWRCTAPLMLCCEREHAWWAEPGTLCVPMLGSVCPPRMIERGPACARMRAAWASELPLWAALSCFDPRVLNPGPSSIDGLHPSIVAKAPSIAEPTKPAPFPRRNQAA